MILRFYHLFDAPRDQRRVRRRAIALMELLVSFGLSILLLSSIFLWMHQSRLMRSRARVIDQALYEEQSADLTLSALFAGAIDHPEGFELLSPHHLRWTTRGPTNEDPQFRDLVEVQLLYDPAQKELVLLQRPSMLQWREIEEPITLRASLLRGVEALSWSFLSSDLSYFLPGSSESKGGAARTEDQEQKREPRVDYYQDRWPQKGLPMMVRLRIERGGESCDFVYRLNEKPLAQVVREEEKP